LKNDILGSIMEGFLFEQLKHGIVLKTNVNYYIVAKYMRFSHILQMLSQFL
jgi:hypothetical protein